MPTKNREIADINLKHRLLEIGRLPYVNRHGFVSTKRYTYDALCEGTVKTMYKETANDLKMELVRIRNLILKAKGDTSMDNLNEIYKSPQFKFFSMFRKEMGDAFCVKVRIHNNPYNISISEEEQASVKLILLRVSNELFI